MFEDRRHVDQLAERRPVRGLGREHLQQPQVLHDVLARSGPLDLDHHPLAIRERCPVDLGDRPRRHGHRVEGLEHVLPRDAELLLHDRDDLFLRQRRDVVLQLRQLLDECRGHQVWPGRQDLPELGERRPELLQGLAEPLGPVAHGLLARAGLRPRDEQLLPRLLRHDGPDRGGAAQELPLDLDIGRRAVAQHGGWRQLSVPAHVRRVDDDHRAPRVVGDPVRDVAQKELLAPGHPEVADDQDVDAFLVRRGDDGPGRVGVHGDVRLPPRAGDLARDLLQLFLGVARAGGLGLTGLGAGRGLRNEDLQQPQLGPEALRHPGGPVDRPRRGRRPVRGHHDLADQLSELLSTGCGQSLQHTRPWLPAGAGTTDPGGRPHRQRLPRTRPPVVRAGWPQTSRRPTFDARNEGGPT